MAGAKPNTPIYIHFHFCIFLSVYWLILIDLVYAGILRHGVPGPHLSVCTTIPVDSSISARSFPNSSTTAPRMAPPDSHLSRTNALRNGHTQTNVEQLHATTTTPNPPVQLPWTSSQSLHSRHPFPPAPPALPPLHPGHNPFTPQRCCTTTPKSPPSNSPPMGISPIRQGYVCSDLVKFHRWIHGNQMLTTTTRPR